MAGLGEMRFMQELGKRYEAMETKFYKGEAIGDVEDNATRMAATNLHADLLGKRKSELKVSGNLNVTAADMSPEERKQWIEQNRAALGKQLLAFGWKPPDEDRPA